jgi:putative tributyrin esterase
MLSSGSVAKAQGEPAAGLSQGEVSTFRLVSRAVRERRRVRVYLPSGYQSDIETRYPVVYLLHGLRSTDVEFFKLANLKEILDRMIASGELAPAIFVAPSGFDGYWTNHMPSRTSNGPRWADYVVDEVVNEIDGRYRTRAYAGSRALVGASMGGFGAMSLALQYPLVFGTAVSLSGALFPAPPNHRKVYLRAWGNPPDMENWARVSPLELMADIDPELAPNIYLHSGDNDELGFAEYAQLAEAILRLRGIPAVLRLTPGRHGWRTWAPETERWLRFVDQAWN